MLHLNAFPVLQSILFFIPEVNGLLLFQLIIKVDARRFIDKVILSLWVKRLRSYKSV